MSLPPNPNSFANEIRAQMGLNGASADDVESLYRELVLSVPAGETPPGWVLKVDRTACPDSQTEILGTKPGSGYTVGEGDTQRTYENVGVVDSVPNRCTEISVRFQIASQMAVTDPVTGKRMGYLRFQPEHVEANRVPFVRAADTGDTSTYLLDGTKVPVFKAQPVMEPDWECVRPLIEARVLRRCDPVTVASLVNIMKGCRKAIQSRVNGLLRKVLDTQPNYVLVYHQFANLGRWRYEDVFEATGGVICRYDFHSEDNRV